MQWTKIENTYLTNMATCAYSDPRRVYHNITHINNMFSWAKVLEIPYNKTLDTAIWCHDVIIDQNGNNEKRSCDWLLAIDPDMEDVCQLIMTTFEHRLSNGDNSLILLDLADFLNQERRYLNFESVFDELINFSNKTTANKYEIRKNMISYLKKLHKGLKSDLEFRTNINNRDTFEKILVGINDVIKHFQ